MDENYLNEEEEIPEVDLYIKAHADNIADLEAQLAAIPEVNAQEQPEPQYINFDEIDEDDLTFLKENADPSLLDHIKALSTRDNRDYNFGSDYNNMDLSQYAKKGAAVNNLKPNVANLFYFLNSKAGNGLKISSGTDGVHSKPSSTHYYGGGIDIGANSSDRNSYQSLKQLLSNPDVIASIKQQFDIDEIIDEGDHYHFGSRNKKQHGGPNNNRSVTNRNDYYPVEDMSYNPDYVNSLTGGRKSFTQNYEDNLSQQSYGQLALDDINKGSNANTANTGDWMIKGAQIAKGAGNLLSMYDDVKGAIGSGVSTGVAAINSFLGDSLNRQKTAREYEKLMRSKERYDRIPGDIFQNQIKTVLS